MSDEELSCLPAEFDSLSLHRRRQLLGDAYRERKDAATITVMIGLKCLNQIQHMGLSSLVNLAKIWGPKITAFYKSGLDRAEGWDESGYCGDLVTDPLSRYADLSDRKRRKIAEWLAQMRREAQGNAYQIGLTTLHEELGIGAVRRKRLETQWLRDLTDFYEDRETQEPLLIDWIEEIGFFFKDGSLHSYNRASDGKPVRKRTVEKMGTVVE